MAWCATLRPGDTVRLGTDIVVRVETLPGRETFGSKVRLVLDAPDEVVILKEAGANPPRPRDPV